MKKKKSFQYRIAVYVPNVDSMQFQTGVLCNLERDKDDGLLYLISEDKSFKELFPGENKKTFRDEEITNLRTQLQSLQDKQLTVDKNGIDNYKNIDKRILEIQFILDKYKEERGSFVFHDNKGVKCISYLRKSTGLHPMHYNIYSNNVFLPVESDSRDAFLSWKSKLQSLMDNKMDSAKKMIMIFGALFAGLILLGLMFGMYKLSIYNSELDKTMIEQKYLCNEIYSKGITEIIATNQQTADILQNTAINISTDLINPNKLDFVNNGVKIVGDILN